MPRPRRELGDWGKVTVTKYVREPDGRERIAKKGERGVVRVRARAKVRDLDGKLRDVERNGPTVAVAVERLNRALAERTAPAPSDAAIKGSTSLLEAAGVWSAWVEESGDHSANTLRVYGSALRKHLVGTADEPRHLAHLRVSEVKRSAVMTRLREIRQQHGDGAAKMARTVLTGILDLAVHHHAIAANPARGLPRQKASQKDRRARAFTREERDAVVAFAGSNDRAKTRDLSDLIAFLAGTGARIGEACALRWSHVDLAEGLARLGPVVVRIKGQGLTIQERGKSATSTRTVALPPDLVARLLERQVNAEPNEWDVVFPSPRGALRDLSNTGHDIRDLLDAAGHPEVTSHIFRKTAATLLLEAPGVTDVQVANHLGHARASLTKDVYVDRRSTTLQAAEVL